MKLAGSGRTKIDPTIPITPATPRGIDWKNIQKDASLDARAIIEGGDGQGVFFNGGRDVQDAVIAFHSDSVITGNGTIQMAAVVNAGSLTPGGPSTSGQLTISGRFRETSTGAININITGTTPVTGYSRVTVTEAASIDGALTVSLVGYTPAASDSFTVFSASSGYTGTFSTLSLPSFTMRGCLRSPVFHNLLG